MRLILDGPLRTLAEIQKEIQDEVRAFGFLGDAATPVELERRPQWHVVHAINHLHIQGKCYKNRAGVFCE